MRVRNAARADNADTQLSGTFDGFGFMLLVAIFCLLASILVAFIVSSEIIIFSKLMFKFNNSASVC